MYTIIICCLDRWDKHAFLSSCFFLIAYQCASLYMSRVCFKLINLISIYFSMCFYTCAYLLMFLVYVLYVYRAYLLIYLLIYLPNFSGILCFMYAIMVAK